MSGSAAGHNARLVYLWEDNGFGADPNDDTPKTFGREVTLDTSDGANNAVRMFDPGSRKAADIIEQAFDGTFSITFTLSNPWFFRAVIAAPSTSGSAAPYEHTFDGEMPSSFQMVQPVTTTGKERTFEGCVIQSCSIDTSVPDTPQVSLNGAYANEQEPSPGTLTEQVDPDTRAYTFAQANLFIAGDRMKRIQNASLSIENNTDIIQELGNRFGVDYSPKTMVPDLNYTNIVHEDDAVDKVKRMYGDQAATEPQSTVENKEQIELIFDQGSTGEDTEAITIVLDGALADQYSRSGVGEAEQDLEETVDEMASDCHVIAENATAEAP